MACNRERKGRKGKKATDWKRTGLEYKRRIKKNKRGGARERPAGV